MPDGLTIRRLPVGPDAESYRAREVRTFSTARHFHDLWQITVVEAGARRILIRAGAVRLTAGMGLVIPPGAPHAGLGEAGAPASFRSLYLDAALVNAAGGLPDRVACVTGADLAPQAGMAEAALAAGDPGPARAFVAALARRAGLQTAPDGHAGPPAPVPPALEAVRQALRASTAAHPDLEALAQAHGLSRDHLVHAFTRAFGLPPYAYNLRHRINLAKGRLAAGGRPAEVALDLGFYDQSHFGARFRAITGISPAWYRRAVRVPDA